MREFGTGGETRRERREVLLADYGSCQCVRVISYLNIKALHPLLRKPQPIKMQRCRALFQWISTKSQGTLKRKQIDYKSQKIGEFVVRLSPSNARSYSHKVSPAGLVKRELSKDGTPGQPRVDRGKTMRPHSVLHIAL